MDIYVVGIPQDGGCWLPGSRGRSFECKAYSTYKDALLACAKDRKLTIYHLHLEKQEVPV